ncbi:DUF3592 domain-containing protein [Sphingobacterium sp. NPDC055346]|nr:DUF3592 domain-containing protein [Sphingobacterium mizutaii]
MSAIIHWSLLFLGLILLGFSISLYLKTKKMLAKGVYGSAVVIENKLVRSTDEKGTSMMYQPVMEIKAGEKTYPFSPNFRSNPPQYKVGEKVPVVYEASEPQSARIVSYWGLHLGSIILMLFALPMLTIGTGYVLFKYGII